MAKYESLPTTPVLSNGVMLRTQQLPELVHLEDPAISVMTDFTQIPPHTISLDETMDHAIHEMETTGVHLLLVMNGSNQFQGILSSEDVWGEKPIQLIQERRIHRDQVMVKMIMVPYSEIIALNYAIVESASVGHIVKTLSTHKQHYALVISPQNNHTAIQTIRGIFTLSQISKQLHKDISEFDSGDSFFS